MRTHEMTLRFLELRVRQWINGGNGGGGALGGSQLSIGDRSEMHYLIDTLPTALKAPYYKLMATVENVRDEYP